LGTYKVHKLTKGITEYGFHSVPTSLTDEETNELNEDREPFVKAEKIFEEAKAAAKDPKKATKIKQKVEEIRDEHQTPSLKELQITAKTPLHESSDEVVLEAEVQKNVAADIVPAIADDNTGLTVCICIQGWLWKKSELSTLWIPVRDAIPSAEVYSLRWETDALQDLGQSLVKTLTTAIAGKVAKYWIVYLSALAAALLAAVALPMAIITVTKLLDNPWSVVRSRATKVGRLLAETLVERVQGRRPVTLLGISLGAEVIFSCLKHLIHLQSEGKVVHGIIENVILLGGACSSDPVTWGALRQLIAGRLVNGYCKSDWVLALVHRSFGLTASAAGLGEIESTVVENIDLSEHVKGHLSYKTALPQILETVQIQRTRFVAPEDVEVELPPETEEQSPNSSETVSDTTNPTYMNGLE